MRVTLEVMNSRYLGTRMLPLLMRCLALCAVMASAMNAQCSLACSLESITGASIPQSDAVVVSEESDHSCCPHPGQDTPCSNSSQVTVGARLEPTGPIFNSIVAIDAIFFRQGYGPLGVARRLRLLTGRESPGLDRPSFISILRI